MKRYIFYILCFVLCNGYAQQNFELKTGDLIFQEACPDDPNNSIKQVTTSIADYRFTHVGMVYINDADSVFVLEATTPEVVLTPLMDYLYPEKSKECYPLSVVGRLKPEYRNLLPRAVEIGISLIGNEYDYGFILGNNKYYCSELVYEILKQANNGKEVFRLNTMTFKSPVTGKITDGWVDHFKKYDLPVPEGQPGINPGAMSQSNSIDILHRY